VFVLSYYIRNKSTAVLSVVWLSKVLVSSSPERGPAKRPGDGSINLPRQASYLNPTCIPKHQTISCKPTAIRLTGAQQGKEGKKKVNVSQGRRTGRRESGYQQVV
jgi:hypothetical protein